MNKISMLCFMIYLVAVPDKAHQLLSNECNYVKSVEYTCNLECVCPKDFQFHALSKRFANSKFRCMCVSPMFKFNFLKKRRPIRTDLVLYPYSQFIRKSN